MVEKQDRYFRSERLTTIKKNKYAFICLYLKKFVQTNENIYAWKEFDEKEKEIFKLLNKKVNEYNKRLFNSENINIIKKEILAELKKHNFIQFYHELYTNYDDLVYAGKRVYYDRNIEKYC